MQSSIERYKSKIHQMEFKTTELEATLSRKEQIITKLQQDLEEVTDTYSNLFILFFLLLLLLLLLLLIQRDVYDESVPLLDQQDD